MQHCTDLPVGEWITSSNLVRAAQPKVGTDDFEEGSYSYPIDPAGSILLLRVLIQDRN